MSVYDQYATRKRLKSGVALKQRVNQRIFELGMAHSPPGATRVLEIGPGDGYIADISRQAGLHYVAVEGSAGVAARMTEKGFPVHQGYVPPLPEGVGGGYTCCFLLHVLEHMQTPQMAARLMDEVFAALVPGGAFVIACPDYARWGSDFFDCDYTHCYPVTRRRMVQLANDHGYQIAYSTVYTGSVFGNRGLPLAWLARLAYPRVLDGLIGPAVPGDVLNRGLLTFLPNLLTILRRPVDHGHSSPT